MYTKSFLVTLGTAGSENTSGNLDAENLSSKETVHLDERASTRTSIYGNSERARKSSIIA